MKIIKFILITIILTEFLINAILQDDPYKILGVGRNSNDKTIKKAFKKLSIKYHPDKN